MAVQVAGKHWSQLPPSPSSSSSNCSSYSQAAAVAAVHSFASAFSSRRLLTAIHPGGRALASPFLVGACSAALQGTPSFERKRGGLRATCRRASDEGFGSFTDDDEDDEAFAQRILDLALKFQGEQGRQRAEGRDTSLEVAAAAAVDYSPMLFSSSAPVPHVQPPANKHKPMFEPPWVPVRPEPSEWPNEVVPAIVEQNAKRVDLPLSLRIIKEKKKKLWGVAGNAEAGESACCSVKKAFSSMVFIIRELQSYALHLRRVLFYEDLQGILDRVHQEMNSSFVWLFQQVFSCTPILMVSVMLLLANFTVYSTGLDAAIAAPAAAPLSQLAAAAEISQPQSHHQVDPRINHSAVKKFSIGKTASVGGSGGGKARPVAGATDDGRSDEFFPSYRTVLPDGINPSPAREAPTEEEEEERLWKELLEEACRMKACMTNKTLMDPETRRRLVSPVHVVLEPEDYAECYHRTELMYQQALSQDPDNGLLLANFAQFLYLVLRDHGRAEYYFKKAVGARPVDPEAVSRYASFLWRGKQDLAAAEDAYLEAIAAEPGNSVYTANYAHFLWSTGGADTCYPLDSSES